MDKTQSQKARLGVFVSFSVALLILILLAVGGSKLLSERKVYFIAYDNMSVGGLEIGAAVKYLGLRIGRVEDISIDPKRISRIIVKISVKENVAIKEDVKAVISYVGITGLKLIELTGGSNSASNLQEGSYIPTGKSMAESITGKAEVIGAKAEKLINNLLDITGGENKENLKMMIKQLTNVLSNFNILLSKNQQHFHGTMQNIESFSKEAVLIAQTTNKSLKRLDKSLAQLEKISHKGNVKKINAMIANLNDLISDSQKTVLHLDLTLLKSRNDYIQSMRLLRESLQNIKEISRMMTEDPSVLIRGKNQRKQR